jgi:hypothetical protein
VEKSKLHLNLALKIMLFQRLIKSLLRQLKVPLPLTLCELMVNPYHTLGGPKPTIYVTKGILFDMSDYILNALMQMFRGHVQLLYVTIPYKQSLTTMELQIVGILATDPTIPAGTVGIIGLTGLRILRILRTPTDCILR